MIPSRASLEDLLRRCGIALAATQIDALWTYHRLLREANARLNLTRIHQFENMVLKHYVDSLIILNFEDLPSPLIDMGTGPGLPGIPLKIARPEVSMILAEPRAHRADFLREVCDRLQLEGVEVHARKVNASFPVKARGIITRAVASIPETLDRVAACLETGGRMLFMKGPDCDDEMTEAEHSHADLFRRVADHKYTLPDTSHARRLVVYERLDTPARSRHDPPPYSGPIKEITSDANPTYRSLQQLLLARGIRKQNQALIAGARFVSEVLESHPERALAWISSTADPTPPEDAPLGLVWLRLEPGLFAALDTFGTHSPLLLVATPEMPAWSDSDPWPEGCTLFLPFQDPENIGAAIRSAAAFGVAQIVLLREAAHPFSPRSARAAGPALLTIPMRVGPPIREFSAQGAPVFALSAEGAPLTAHSFPNTFGMIVGMEGPGLPDHLREGPTLQIPIAEGVESLNAAVSTSIALYEWRRSRYDSIDEKNLSVEPLAPDGQSPAR